MRKLVLKTIAVSLLAVASLQAGTTTFNFDSDPSGVLDISSNVDPPNWRATGGNPATGGYLAISDSLNSQYSVIVFDDFDAGLIVKAFTFSMDVRVGNATGNAGRPADGFSVSYARANDPVVLQAAPRDTSQFAVSGGPENGTSTGIAISFDTWSGNTLPDGADIEGLIVRVDNVTVLRQAMATRNGLCNDITSLQTGPYDAAADAAGMGGSPDGLCWQKVEVILDDAQKLTVKYKGVVLLDQFQTSYAPSAGRLVLAGRTGGANENTHVDNISITTVPADTFVIGPVTGSPVGFNVLLNDSGPSVVDTNTITVKLDGNTITPTSITKSGGITTVSYRNTAAFLVSGSVHSVFVSASDTRPVAGSATLSFTVPAYATIPTDYALAAPATTAGMVAGVYQFDNADLSQFNRFPGDANWTRNAEQMWARGFIDPATGQPYVNAASPDTSDVSFVNWDQNAADPGGDNFNSTTPAAGPIANDAIPGIAPGNVQNIVAEITGYAQLTRGAYRMGVNSDDGFKVLAAPGTPSVFGITLGEFDGGRGAADSTFTFVVEQDGFYPMRLLWWEGGGGANVEWFTVNLDTGVKTLVNYADPNSLKVFRVGNGRAVVKKLLPANGYGGADISPTIRAELVDGRTTVVDGSVQLVIDGAPVTPNVVNGATTVVTYTPATPFAFGSAHSGSLIWTESTTPTPTVWTNNFTFTVRQRGVQDLPANSFWIEAEDFNHSGGQTVAAASTMPYAGNAYDQLSATVNIDYQRPEEPSSDLYRVGESPNVPMDPNQTAGTLDTQRPGGFEVASNYKMGWTANGAWYNYTRTIPAGVYTAYGAFSHGDVNADVGGSLGLVTGATTTSQTVANLGTFNGPAPGGWGENTLVPLRNGSDYAYFKLPGGPVTIRMTTRNGDYDWFVLSPATVPAQMSISPAPPITGERERRDMVVTARIEDFSTTVQTSAVRVKFDNQDVTGSSTITKAGEVISVSYDPPGLLDIGSSHTAEVSATDSANNTIVKSTSFNVHIYPTAGSFLIEAEDFNSNGAPTGATATAANTMPYVGGAFAGLNAVLGTDYVDNDGRDSQPYRDFATAGQNVNHDANATVGTLDTDRGEWSVASNYKIGWTGNGTWYNYTRTFPAGNYQVWVALSYDGRAAGQLNGRLEQVDSPTAPTTTNVLGTFDAPGSGGWGANNLVQMKDGGGNVAVVPLSGAQTVRYNPVSGDYDYLMFVPAAAPRRITGATVAGGNVTITWTGGGTLESSPTLAPATWTSTGDSDGSFTEAATGTKFYRVNGP